MSKAFASQADLADKKITFEQLSAHCWAYTAEGDPNSGVIIGDKFILVSDCHGHAGDGARPDRAHPQGERQADQVRAAHALPRRARAGRQRLFHEGATEIIASQGTLRPDRRARQGGHAVRDGALPAPVPQCRERPGAHLADDGHRRRRTRPRRDAGQAGAGPGRRARADLASGPGHTRGDTIAWVEAEKVLFSGDLVEYEAGVYTGDAHLEEWPATLEAAARRCGPRHWCPGVARR